MVCADMGEGAENQSRGEGAKEVRGGGPGGRWLLGQHYAHPPPPPPGPILLPRVLPLVREMRRASRSITDTNVLY